MKRNAILCGLLLAAAAALPLSAQTGYLPPNPLSPTLVGPPSMETPPLLVSPVVTPVAPIGSTQSAPASGTASGASKAVSSGALPSSLSELTNPASLLNALAGTGGDSQGLDALTALLGGGTAGTSAASATSALDSATLQKILSLLEKQQSDAGTPAKAAAPAPVRIASGGEIVRFAVNNYDLAATATSVVSSILTRDGSFLVTGQRTYTASSRARSETFYLLCRKTGTVTYQLFADVSQDYPNEYSFMYQLARRTPLAGTLTGDLLVFRNADPAWKLDLVIRIISPTVSVPSAR